MKKALLLLLNIFLWFSVSAQRRKIDSLQALLPVINSDSSKVKVLNKLAASFVTSTPDSGLFYANQSLALARQLHWQQGEAHALMLLGSCYKYQSKYETALKCDSLALKIFRKIGNRVGESSVLGNIGNIYGKRSIYDSALANYNDQLKICEEIGDLKGQASAIGNMSIIYNNTGNTDTAIRYAQKALEISRQLGDSVNVAIFCGSIGNSYYHLSRYQRALDYYFRALRIGEKSGVAELIASNTENIGMIYNLLGELKSQKRYLDYALQLFTRLGDSSYLAATFVNIGLYYSDILSFDSAIKYHSAGLNVAANIGDKQQVALATGNIGSVLLEQHKYAEALPVLERALALTTEIGDETGKATVTGDIGKVYLGIAKSSRPIFVNDNIVNRPRALALARQYLTRAAEMEVELGESYYLQLSLIDLAEIDVMFGDFQSAYRHLLRYTVARDSIAFDETSRKMSRLEAKYEFEKTTDSIRVVTQEQLSLAYERRQSTIRLFVVSGFATIVLASLGFYVYRRRSKERFERESRALRLQALNAQMSEHFIGNAIRNIAVLVKRDATEAADRYQDMFSGLVRQVMEHSEHALISLSSDLEVLDSYLALDTLRFEPGTFHYFITVDPGIDTEAVMVPPMVLQTVCENAVRHGFRSYSGGTLTVQISREADRLLVSVEDNGIGRSKVADIDKNRKSLGTELAKQLVRTAGKRRDASSFRIVDLTDAQGIATGTRVEITLPLITG